MKNKVFTPPSAEHPEGVFVEEAEIFAEHGRRHPVTGNTHIFAVVFLEEDGPVPVRLKSDGTRDWFLIASEDWNNTFANWMEVSLGPYRHFTDPEAKQV
jgi:hypothetical protein